MQIQLHINGERHSVDVDPDTPLLYVLRNDLGLRGAKFGCGLGQCGACTVLLGDEAVTSCDLAVSAVGEREITTIESLGTPEALHPIQQAFVDETAAQCGYCTPGFIVRTLALLRANPEPSDAEIRAALDENLCRCGSHPRVLRAVRSAAEALRA